MKSNTTLKHPERSFYVEVLIRIRLESVRPVEPTCEGEYPITNDNATGEYHRGREIYRNELFEIARDNLEIKNRVNAEGLRFLTSTLPAYGKALDKALLGQKDSFNLIPFRKGKDGIRPILFGSLLGRVIDANGDVRSDACAQSVRYLRQLTYAFYKLDVGIEKQDENKVINAFIQVDQELPKRFVGFPRALGGNFTSYTERLANLPDGSDANLDGGLGACVQVARFIIGSVLGNCNPHQIWPKHGPGAVSTGEKGSEKNSFNQIIERLDRVYPHMEWMRFNLSHVEETLDDPPEEIVKHGTAKVVLVPKDSRGPRLISCEPLANQWIQQGQMSAIVRAIEQHTLTSGRVNFSDQTVNGSLALASSLSQENATLDMKDASDRVSWALIELLFPIHWIEALWASRSAETVLPNSKVVQLKKFAPMGSAVCFPVEALIFFALSVGAIYSKRMRRQYGSEALTLYGEGRHNLDVKSIRKIARTVYVYGDDLITPLEDSESVIAYLESFYLKFNKDKCCRKGFFRESCGVDAFLGHNVTPVRFRTPIGQSLLTPESLISWVEYSNSLYAKGYIGAAEHIATFLLQKRRIATVCVPPDQLNRRFGGICFVRPYPGAPSCNKRRYNRKLQRCEVLLDVIRPAETRSPTLGYNEWLRHVSQKGEQAFKPSVSVTDIYTSVTGSAGVYAVPRCYKLVRGWVNVD